jgi:hypothetical protein
MTNHKLDRDHNGRDEYDNDNNQNQRGEKAIAPAPAGGGGALASLTALGAVLNSVDTASVIGRSGLPMLQFKSRESNGTWMFGQERNFPEDGSHWAVNPMTFRWGYVCFGNDKTRPPRDRLVPVSQPKPDVMELPDQGNAEWQEQWTVNLKCVNGTDSGTEVVFKSTTIGGIQAVAALIEAVRDRINSSQHDGKVAPIVRLEKDSYQHSQYGRVYTPVLMIVDWMTLDGPAPAPASPPPAEQPRRRRFG